MLHSEAKKKKEKGDYTPTKINFRKRNYMKCAVKKVVSLMFPRTSEAG